MENGYIGVGVGLGGKWRIPPPAHFTQADQPAGGRFHIWCTGGDPTTLQDDDQYLNFSLLQPPGPGDRWGAFQLMVDAWSSEEDASERVWAIFERGETSAILGDQVDGAWTIFPYAPTDKTNVIYGVWYPIPTGGMSPTTGDEVQINAISIRCEMETRLLRDTVRFKLTITNEDYVDHLIGLRVYADLMTSPVDDGTWNLRNVVSVPGYPLVTDRSLLSGKDIPPVVELFNSQSEPVTSLRLTFKEQGATPPDKVGLDGWLSVCHPSWSYWYDWSGRATDPFSFWRYEPIPHQYIPDVAYGAFWKARRVPAGQSMTFIHYIGLGCATSDFTKPNLDNPQYVAAVQGPRTLKYYSDLGVGQLYPEPFTISAYMYNTEKFTDFQNASFTLTLPDALTLDDSEGGKYTKSVARVAADSEQAMSWKVKPVGSPTGIMDYMVSFSAAPVGGTTVRRQINIPATERESFSTGWHMISVPFNLSNPDPETALGLSDCTFWRYDPHGLQYQPVTTLVPGEAYWLKPRYSQTTNMAPGSYSPIPWADTQGYPISLQQGWNLVGNPFLYTITLGEVRFYYRDYGTVGYEEAVARGLISGTVFWWDPLFRRYNWSSHRTVQIKPWQGYWVRALRPGVTMLLTPASQIGAALGGQPPIDDDDGNGPPPVP